MDELTLKVLRLSLSKEPATRRSSKPRTSKRIAKSKPVSKIRSGRRKPEFVKVEDQLKAAVSQFSPLAMDFTFVLPEWRTRWLHLASRIRLTETPEGSKVQPTTLSCRSSSVSVKSSRKAPRLVSNTMYVPEHERYPDSKRLAFKPFMLLDLPLEMRLSIYRSTLCQTDDQRLLLSLDRKSSGVPKVSRLPHAAFALLSTSRQIREEGLPILYQSNHFYTRAVKQLSRTLSLPNGKLQLQ